MPRCNNCDLKRDIPCNDCRRSELRTAILIAQKNCMTSSKRRQSARGNFIFHGELRMRDRLQLVGLLYQEIAQLLEPILYLGPEKFAPGTDWWSCVAGNKHRASADAHFFAALSKDDRILND